MSDQLLLYYSSVGPTLFLSDRILWIFSNPLFKCWKTCCNDNHMVISLFYSHVWLVVVKVLTNPNWSWLSVRTDILERCERPSVDRIASFPFIVLLEARDELHYYIFYTYFSLVYSYGLLEWIERRLHTTSHKHTILWFLTPLFDHSCHRCDCIDSTDSIGTNQECCSLFSVRSLVYGLLGQTPLWLSTVASPLLSLPLIRV